jgi:hypothetical protein
MNGYWVAGLCGGSMAAIGLLVAWAMCRLATWCDEVVELDQ